MVFLEYINIQKVRKAILYFFCILVALWLQTGVFSRVAPLGVRPFFLPALAAAIGLWESGVWGAVFGLIAGAFCDAAYADSTVTYMVTFALFGFAAGVLGEYVINRRFVAAFILSAAALLVSALCQIVPLWIFKDTPLEEVLPVALLQVLWSLPFIVPFYFAAKAISGRNRGD